MRAARAAPDLHGVQLSAAPEGWLVPIAQGKQMYVSPLSSDIICENVPGGQACARSLDCRGLFWYRKAERLQSYPIAKHIYIYKIIYIYTYRFIIDLYLNIVHLYL